MEWTSFASNTKVSGGLSMTQGPPELYTITQPSAAATNNDTTVNKMDKGQSISNTKVNDGFSMTEGPPGLRKIIPPSAAASNNTKVSEIVSVLNAVNTLALPSLNSPPPSTTSQSNAYNITTNDTPTTNSNKYVPQAPLIHIDGINDRSSTTLTPANILITKKLYPAPPGFPTPIIKPAAADATNDNHIVPSSYAANNQS